MRSAAPSGCLARILPMRAAARSVSTTEEEGAKAVSDMVHEPYGCRAEARLVSRLVNLRCRGRDEKGQGDARGRTGDRRARALCQPFGAKPGPRLPRFGQPHARRI